MLVQVVRRRIILDDGPRRAPVLQSPGSRLDLVTRGGLDVRDLVRARVLEAGRLGRVDDVVRRSEHRAPVAHDLRVVTQASKWLDVDHGSHSLLIGGERAPAPAGASSLRIVSHAFARSGDWCDAEPYAEQAGTAPIAILRLLRNRRRQRVRPVLPRRSATLHGLAPRRSFRPLVGRASGRVRLREPVPVLRPHIPGHPPAAFGVGNPLLLPTERVVVRPRRSRSDRARPRPSDGRMANGSQRRPRPAGFRVFCNFGSMGEQSQPHAHLQVHAARELDASRWAPTGEHGSKP